MSIDRTLVPATLAFVLLAATPVFADPLPTGTVRGRVLRAPELEPVAYVQVVVLGSRRGALADEQGRFVVESVPAGSHLLRVTPIGAPALTREIDVTAGANEVGDIILPDPDPPPPHPVPVGALAAIRPGELAATIRPVKSKYHVGDTPEFRVRIRNRGESPVFLVQSVDASDSWASPRVNIDIAGPDGGFVVAPLVGCGNNNGISAADFAEVGPGKEFDPYASGWLDAKVRQGRFAKPGRYKATFRYVTMETDPRRWTGGPCQDCDLSVVLRDLLVQVPAVELTATTTFEVVP